MKPIRKIFDDTSLFPFVFVYRDQKNPQSELPNHFHDWYEIVYVHSGKGTFFIDFTFYNMEAGDIFLLSGNTIHYAIPDKDDPVTSTAIFFHPLFVHNRSVGDSFSYLQLFDESTKTKHYRYSLNLDQKNQLESLIMKINEEMNNEEFGYKQGVLLHLQLLLLNLHRSKISQHSNKSNPTPAWLNDILRYIEDHFTEELSLSTLAAYGDISTAHLSRVFKQMTSMTISEYITAKKILLAKDLLLTTNENVATIAEQCGFESMPYFFRTFKKYIGATPSNYRKTQ